MADFASALRARLTASAPVAALVGTRIYPMARPQNSLLPAVRYQVISSEADRVLKGETGVQATRVQADCFAETYLAAQELGVKVKDALLQPATAAGVIFSGSVAQGPIDELGDDTPSGYIFRTRVDLLVRHRLA